MIALTVLLLLRRHNQTVPIEGKEGTLINRMEKSNRECYQPACLFAHHLISKLSIIVGACDLASEQKEPGTEYAMHLALIRDTAKEMAKELVAHQCNLTDAVREEVQKHLVA